MSARRAAAPPHKAALQRGNTLIEILVSVLLFAFGLLGLVGLQARTAQYSTDAEDRTRAAQLADDLAAQMRLARTVDVTRFPTVYANWKVRLKDPVSGIPYADDPPTPTVTGNSAVIQITWKPPRAPAAAASSQLTTTVVLTAEEAS